MMQLAVMQPYFFPYIGYFQLIAKCDEFVFLDNVNHIKRGWVHRNKILVNGEPTWFALSLIKASQNKKINEIEISSGEKEFGKMLKSLTMSYKKADYFDEVYPVLESLLVANESNQSSFLERSIETLCTKMSIGKTFHRSSEFSQFTELRGENKILAICKELGADSYINPPGGRDLYSADLFQENDITLNFLEPKITEYGQFTENFVPAMSIIDVLMHNGFTKTGGMLNV